MLISVPVFLIVRYFLLKKRGGKINRYHEIALLLLVMFSVGLASQAIIPKFEFGVGGFHIIKDRVHTTNLVPFKVVGQTYREAFVYGHINYFIINFLGNIIMFMPFGFAIPLLWKIEGKKVILIGLCCSCFIEFCQLFLSRGTDVDDLMLNTLGTALGYLLYKLFEKKYGQLAAKFKL
ncbi:MAG: VanZ family protein [Clostridia bacterium]|nr:VanZ family protein [Clostridia bacterium]